MIGLDTNILLRFVLDDDSVQSPKARAILQNLTPENQGVVNSIVLAEFAWTLRKGHGYTKSEIVGAIRNMLRSRSYFFPDRNAIADALILCDEAGMSLTDALLGHINRAAGCLATLTFDQKAGKSDLFQQAI
jgi:predicted nucleic-acid-binding protein